MPTKICNICNLTLDISNFGKSGKWYRNKCKQCRNDEQKCKHNTRKDNCPECNPKLLCEHDIRKRDCRECSPQNFCKHGSQKYSCPECNPKILCKHDISKWSCRKCNPKLLCEHDTRKYNCPECNPKILCKHDTRKYDCPKCSPQNLCKHDILKYSCPECNPKISCIHCKMIYGKKRYIESLDKKVRCCAGCFYNFYPNDEIPRRFKCKQHYFNEKLIEEFGVNFFQYDKKIKCGCSGRRPDWFIDCFKYSIIIELDEDQHKYTSCDEKRMMELFQDLGNRQLVLIRINPDKYKEDGKTIKSCFTFSKTNTIKATTKNFNKRFNLLVEKIKYYIDNEPEKEITVEKLFFS